MAIREKVTQEDLEFYEILRNPVLGPEFIYNFDLDEKYDEMFEFVWYQKEMVCDFNPYVSIATARATGKTVSLVSLILWALVYNMYPKDYILYTVPSKVHLEPVFTGLVRAFKRNSFLKKFLTSGSGINSSDYKITLLNGSILLCRIAGQSGTGANLIGLHTPFICVDEGGYFPHAAWQEMQPSLNVWTPGYRELVAGVPTGMREKNVLYQADMESDVYTKHRVSALQNPRMTEVDLAKAIDQYGGDDTDDYIHYVLGQHGKPVFSIFDRTTMKIDNYPVLKSEVNGVELNNESSILSVAETFPMIKDLGTYETTMFGIDLGYTEPTAILIMRVSSAGNIRFHGRIQLTKVSYPIQEKFIDILDSRFKPSILEIDKGSSGMSLIQHLMEDDSYKGKDYKSRVIPIDFSSSIVIGRTADGEEIKTKTKAFTTSILQDYTNNHRITYSSTDIDLIAELERMTFTKTPSGEIVYKTVTPRGGKRGEDHFTAALLCGVGAYYLENENLNLKHSKPKLMRAIWV